MDADILKVYTRLNKHYPIRKIMDYFNILQETGITNMYGGSPFLYMGKKMIEHEYTYKYVPDEEAFEELLEHADDIRQKLIYGAYKQVHEKTDSDDDRFVRGVESQMRKDAQDLLRVWMHFKGKVINEWEEKPGLWSSIKRGTNNDDIKNYLFRRIPLDVFKTIVSDNFKWGIKEFEPQYSLYDFHNGVVNIIVEDLVNYDYIGELVSSDFGDNLKEQTYNDLHQFLYDMLFETAEKAYAKAVRQYEEEYGYLSYGDESWEDEQ